jgi:hypothetical protein
MLAASTIAARARDRCWAKNTPQYGHCGHGLVVGMDGGVGPRALV